MTPYKRAFVDIMEEVVTAMPVPVVTIFKVVAVSAHTWKLYVDDFFYAAKDYSVTIQAKKYKVVSMDDTPENFILTVTDTTGTLIAPVAGTFSLYRVFFFHGTPIDTANEIGDVAQASDKYPMIWLNDGFKEKNNWDPSNAVDREVTAEICFLDQANIKYGPTDNRWEAFIKPMMKFRDYFMFYLQRDKSSFMTWGQTTDDEYYSRFGVWLIGKGVEKALFADNLSGVKMNGTFTIYTGPGYPNCVC